MGRFAGTLTVILLLALGLPPRDASAQIADFAPMDAPIPKEWREPIAVFFRDLGVADTHSLLEFAKAGPTVGIHHPNSITFRIDHSAVCDEDICLTVIGRIESGKFLAEAMFGAGNSATVGDYGVSLLGFGTLPIWFKSSKSIVTVLDTPRGWIIVPQTR